MDSLTPEQKDAFDAIVKGESVFLTGPGGTGKSHLLRLLYAHYKGLTGKIIAVTALTGCAALLIGPWAKTLHSWAGVGLGRSPVQAIVHAIRSDSRKKKRWLTTSCLIIDEVSMLTASFLEYLDAVAKGVRKSEKPFGGLQIVFVGDFYQLPPVVKEAQATSERLFAFESPVWGEIVQRTIQLTKIQRQADPTFQAILNEARVGELSAESYATLEARKTMDWKRQEVKPTLLFTKNTDVNSINQTQLDKLPGEARTYTAETKAPPRLPAQVVEWAVEKLDKDAPYEIELKLKERAQVILLTNMDPDAGLVNGSRGVVTGFSGEGHPMVKFLNGPPFPVRVEPAAWESDAEVEKERVVRNQIPLRLAYAITIHKAQGASLDSALVDVGPSTFEYGQAYVALSRVRSLEALYIYEIHPKAFKAHPTVKAFYAALELTKKVDGVPSDDPTAVD